MGKHFASRVSASLLKAVGLEELVCKSAELYEAMAVRLAMDRRYLSQIRSQLAANKSIEPLFDTAGTVRSLETAYMKMWDNYLQGREPQPFSVPAR